MIFQLLSFEGKYNFMTHQYELFSFLKVRTKFEDETNSGRNKAIEKEQSAAFFFL